MLIIKIILISVLALLSGCAQLPDNSNNDVSYAYTNTENTTLGKHAQVNLSDKKHMSSMYWIDDGVDAFVTRVALLKVAEKSIDVQYFIWHADLIGK